MRRFLGSSALLPVVLFASVGFLAMGYHPGAEDDGVYLAAVHSAVRPALYPFDAAFFKMQMRTSIFDTWMAHFVHFTGISVGWSELLWQFLSILLIIWAGWNIVSHLFEDRAARWGGVAMLAAMLTLPVAGTALYLADQYLHPRNPATALILFAVDRILAGRRWQAVPLLLLSFVLHPLMGALGASFCCVLTLTLSEPVRNQVRSWRERLAPEGATAELAPAATLIPFGWMFDKPSASFLDAIRTRHCYHLFDWTWYEWLGALGPLVIFWGIARIARKQDQPALARFATAVLIYGCFQQAFATIILAPAAKSTLCTLEPMRFLQLVYIFMTLVGGAYLGKYFLKGRMLRWAAFLLLANGGMFLAQRQLFASTEHIEIPGRQSANPWLQAFTWIRQNTPTDAYFALDPDYMSAPGEDNHGFRAITERSVLADADKDTAVVTKAPNLGPEWEREVNAQQGWKHFQASDFERLKTQFGVTWVLVSSAQTSGLPCPWHNAQLAVCRVP